MYGQKPAKPMSRVLEKYLANYAEPIVAQVATLPGHWQACVVIPAYDEPAENLLRIWHSLAQSDCLLILVINQPDADKPCALNGEQSSLLSLGCVESFSAPLSQHWSSDNGQLRLLHSRSNSSNAAVLMVDCYSAGRKLASDQGVGLARKIGADILCALYRQDAVTEAWIFSTDADVRLPTDYLNCIENVASSAAMILLPFRHQPCDDAGLNAAQAVYDAQLQYYVDSLRWAKSPYAYHSMGSAQVISIEHYAAVRGFPKRSAGEDFYLLNKLLKTGEVIERSQPLIEIQTRRSARTPFGTGVAVAKIEAQQAAEQTLFYHPSCFIELRAVLRALPEYWHNQASGSFSPATADVLSLLGFDNALSKARNNSRTAASFCKHMHTWLDAFRTLKFVHLMRDRHYPSIPLAELRLRFGLGLTLPEDLSPELSLLKPRAGDSSAMQ